MGLLTLEQMRTELSLDFGGRGLGNDRLTLWLNLVYFELCGMMEFEDLRCEQYFDTVAGVYIYELPEKYLGFKSVWDVNNKTRLIRHSVEDIGLIDADITGKPEHWAVRANTLTLSPIPDDAYRIKAIYIKEPTALSVPDDITLIPATWDFTILLLAKQFGHMAFIEDNLMGAQILLKRAIENMQTRKQDEQWQAKTPIGGLQVAWDWTDLESQQ